jgi:hypothetical protein
MTLTVADIERWDAGDVREVFQAATSRAQAVQDAADGLAELPAFTTWGGEAAEAAKDAIGKTRADLDAHGREALAVADAARSAADEIERIRSELATLKADAAALDMEIDPVSGRVVAGPGFSGNPMELLLKQQQLQPRVDALIAEANLVDMALANAIDMASGDTPIPASADEPGSTPHEILAAGTTTDPKQPANLDDALAAAAGQPVPPSPSALDQILGQHTGTGEPDDGTLSTQYPLTAPIVGADPSVVNRQRAKVDAAQQNVNAAQAALDEAAAQTYTQGAGAGPNHGATDLLTQKLFDARRELTDQTDILKQLNLAVVESGGHPVDVPPLPPNADVQALPPEPSKLADASRALSEGSFGIIPDYVETADVLTNWGEHSGAEQTGAILDIAGSVPLPGGKLVTEGVEHGLDALGVFGRHADDMPAGMTNDIPHDHSGSGDISHEPSSDLYNPEVSDSPSYQPDLFDPAELDMASTAHDIYTSSAMNELRQAAQNGTAAEVDINGYKVLYEPDIPGSGFSLASFGERGFAIGPEGMASEQELAQTVAHEVYRVNMTEIPDLGIDAARAASETQAAFDFAQKFGNSIQSGGG